MACSAAAFFRRSLLTVMLCLSVSWSPSSSSSLAAQVELRVSVIDSISGDALAGAAVYFDEVAVLLETGAAGKVNYTFEENTEGVTVSVYTDEFTVKAQFIELIGAVTEVTVGLVRLSQRLDAVTVVAQRERNTALRRLRAVEGTAIYAGRKTEVVNVEALTANKAANQARQLYAQVSGINIYESDDAGLQLSIGGRGLDPNRSASFNTRQNGYDISADVLGYPESYYTPPAEALREIQVVRGAAGLQYGTQFGGLVNFVFHPPKPNDKLEFVARQTVGSFGLLTSFNSVSGAVGKLGYYGYFNYKRGDGFRPNSGFNSRNAYLHLDYKFGEASKVSFEYTYLDYLSQQAGGLTDAQFYSDPFSSNRSRNWFDVDWQLFSLRYDRKFNDRTNFSLNVFGLDAARGAVGFRTNRVSQVDDPTAARDLLIGEFNNYGAEARLLHRYQLGRRSAIALVGAKYYRAENSSVQGPGTAGSDATFSLAEDRFPSYPTQSSFAFPNLNVALFGEHILYVTDRFTVTPGVRFEYIKTESVGTFRRIDFDLAGNPIRDGVFPDDRTFERNLILFGAGLSYRGERGFEAFANVSQNYRSVTFNDIRTVNPSFRVDPDISDEDGYTADAGVRWGSGGLKLTANMFGLRYNDRLGEVLTPEVVVRGDGMEVRTGRIIRLRSNIGSAFIYGLESLVAYELAKGKTEKGGNYAVNVFANTSITRSRYTSSAIAGVEGNEVEFIPLVNLRTGIRAGFRDLLASLQYSYLSRQFTDASNAAQDRLDNQSGIVGSIPAYGIVDLSLSYRYRKLLLETGATNVLNNVYFTRRATGYPGPGIIPSAPRSFYLTIGITL